MTTTQPTESNPNNITISAEAIECELRWIKENAAHPFTIAKRLAVLEALVGQRFFRFVSAEQLRCLLFEPQCRPDIATIYDWRKAKIIPFYRIGKSYFFQVEKVLRHLEEKSLWKAR
jgi:hypothetical protein